MAAARPVTASTSRSSVKKMEEINQNAKEVQLRHLINVTYDKIEELKSVLCKEAKILGLNEIDPVIHPVIQKQDRLMQGAVQIFSECPKVSPLNVILNKTSRNDRKRYSGHLSKPAPAPPPPQFFGMGFPTVPPVHLNGPMVLRYDSTENSPEQSYKDERRRGSGGYHDGRGDKNKSGSKLYSPSRKVNEPKSVGNPTGKMQRSNGMVNVREAFKGADSEILEYEVNALPWVQGEFPSHEQTMKSVQCKSTQLQYPRFEIDTATDPFLEAGYLSPSREEPREVDHILMSERRQISVNVSEHNPNIDSSQPGVDLSPSWYGSLDRNYTKKRQEGNDRRRRHTKTIGSMSGIDFVKKSQELRPDEQYEIGLPHVTAAAFAMPKFRNRIRPTLSVPHFPSDLDTRASMACDGSNPYTGRSFVNDNEEITPVHTRQKSRLVDDQLIAGDFSRTDYSNYRIDTGTSLTCGQLFGSPVASDISKTWLETHLDDAGDRSQFLPRFASTILESSLGPGLDASHIISSGLSRLDISESANEKVEGGSKSSDSNESKSGFTNESVKPFEMSDYYKYSTKFRTQHPPKLQDDNSQPEESTSNSLKRSSLIDEPLSDAKRKLLMDYFSNSGGYFSNSGGKSNETERSSVSQGFKIDDTPLCESKKNYLIDHFTHYNSDWQREEARNNPNVRYLLKIDDKPLSEFRKTRLIDYFTKSAADKASILNDINDNPTSQTDTLPVLPPKVSRDRKPQLNSDRTTAPAGLTSEEASAWVMDKPTFV